MTQERLFDFPDPARPKRSRSMPAQMTWDEFGLLTAPSAPRQARVLIEGSLTPSTTRDDAQLLATELVANAVHHGAPPIELRIGISASTLRVEVADGSRSHLLIRSNGTSSLDGRGLRLVEGIATSWGVDYRRQGKSVWFELDRTRPAL